MIHSFERFFKTAIVDRNPSISSAALVSSYHLFHGSKEVIRRWANEVQEAINSKNSGSSFFSGSSSVTSSYFGFGSGSQPTTPGHQTIQSTSYIAPITVIDESFHIPITSRHAIRMRNSQSSQRPNGSEFEQRFLRAQE